MIDSRDIDLHNDILPNRQVKDMYNDCQRLVLRWAPYLPEELIIRINHWFRDDQGLGSYKSIFKLYSDKLAPHAEELGYLSDGIRSPNIVGAGLFCYIGQALLYYSQFGDWNNPLDTIPNEVIRGPHFLDHCFNFVLLYLNVDYFLDSTRITPSDKQSTLLLMYQLINDPDCLPPPRNMKGLVQAYKEILRVSPKSKGDLIRLFIVEVESVQVQRNPQASRDKYLETALHKGGMTCVAIQSIFGAKYNRDCYTIGAVLQLIDDMMDVYEDQEDGVHTIATHDLKVYGCLDYLFVLAVKLLDGIRSTFLWFKLLLMQVLTYTASMGNRFTRSLRNRMMPMAIIRWAQGHHAMDLTNRWIIELIKGLNQTEN